MSQYINDIVNNWSDRKLQKNTFILTEIFPLKSENSVDLPDFKKDQDIRLLLVKASLRLLSFFGYRIKDRYSIEQIKPILREEKGVVVGLCNKKNLELVTRMLKFFGENNMGILSGIFCLAICNALEYCSNFRELVGDNNVLGDWLNTQKYLSKENITELQGKYFGVKKPVKSKDVEKKVVEKKVVEKKYPTFECNICASEKNITQKVTCPKCKFECCKTCLKRHLLSTSKLNPSCMNCNTPLSLDFVYDNTDEGFYNKEYREHRADIILSMEKSLLPTTQEDANIEAKQREEKNESDIIKKWPKDAKKKAEYYRDKNRVYFNEENPEKAKEYMDKFFDINNRMFAFDDVKRNMYRGFHLERFKYIMDESKPFILQEFRQFFDRPVPVNDRSFIHLQDILRGRERGEGGQKEKKTEMPKRLVFIGPCPEQDCKGYLDESYVCGLCKKEACKNCRLPKHTDKCNPDIVATVKMMDRETKRCPKCNVPIYKTEGCDQMWCPSCHTAFSWITGEIETGRIHNPHYYQWMREQGGGQMAREQGDVRCGGAVLYRDLLDTLRRLRLPRYEELLAKLHSLIGDIRGVQLRRLVVNNDPDVNRDLRINYLLGDYKNEKEWLSKIKMREKSKEKRTSEILILQMLADTLEVILENIYRATSKDDVNLQLAQLPELHSYVNKEFIKIEKRFKNKSFRLKDWKFDFTAMAKRDS